MTPANSPQQFYLLGHRGARAELLENSEIGFAHVQSLSPMLNGVEFDVQLTADNQLVVVHDETLLRLANQQGYIGQKTLAELQNYVQSDRHKFINSQNTDFLSQPILALSQLSAYLVGYQHIELEVKTHRATDYQVLAAALFNVIQHPAWQALAITITSFDTAFLTVWHNLYRHLLPYKMGLLLQSNTTLASEIAFLPFHHPSQIYAVCNSACRLGCSQVGVYFALINPDLAQTAHRFGLTVTAWTVNDIAVAKQLLGLGVTTIITDYPSLFCQQLKIG